MGRPQCAGSPREGETIVNDIGQWIERAYHFYRNSQYGRQIMGGCLSFLALIVASIFYLFTDQQI